VIRRGGVWWVDFGVPRGFEPVVRRPAVVVSANFLHRSRLRTATVAAITSNVRLAVRPGNVLVPEAVAGLERESVVDVTQLLTVDEDELHQRIGVLPTPLPKRVDDGLRLALSLRW
jgi:mRNA interferase MazF